MLLLTIILLIFIILLLFSLSFAFRERRRRKGRPFFDNSPVELIEASDIDPIFASNEFGPSINTETLLIGDAGSFASTNLTEAWILCVLAKSASTIFEFGTCSGRTTYMLARNAPEDATIGTITLTPETAKNYQAGSDDPDLWSKQALIESNYTKFLYSDTNEEKKIRQFLGDSKTFDEHEWINQCDLIFIDGSHAYSYVKSDTEKSMRMIKNNGFIIWHDFSPACPGVWNYLSELATQYPVKHIKGTRLGILKFTNN